MSASAFPAEPTGSPAGEQNATLTVANVARLSGLSVRNIRAYQTAGLLQAPVLHGRQALYSKRHVSRLALIRELRALGFGLESIGEMLARIPGSAASPYALIAQMFSRGFFQVEQPQRMTLAQLAAHWREAATPEQVHRLVANGLYQAVEPNTSAQAMDQDTPFDVLSPTLWALGKQMAELQIPLNTVLDMQEKLITHCRSLAGSYVDQFVAAMVKEVMQAPAGAAALEVSAGDEAALPPDLLRTIHRLIERLRPIAIGSVSAAFPVVLQQEFDRDVVNRIQTLVRQLQERSSGSS